LYIQISCLYIGTIVSFEQQKQLKIKNRRLKKRTGQTHEETMIGFIKKERKNLEPIL
jgi:hypothetical protein